MSALRPLATRPRRDLLPTVREVLASADDAVVAMAFVDTRGIHLVGAELRDLATRRRLAARRRRSGSEFSTFQA